MKVVCYRFHSEGHTHEVEVCRLPGCGLPLDHPMPHANTEVRLRRRSPSEEAAWHEGYAYGVKMSALATPVPTEDADGHEDDGEGGCVICREWEPFTDGVYNRVRFPCPTVILARSAPITESAQKGADE